MSNYLKKLNLDSKLNGIFIIILLLGISALTFYSYNHASDALLSARMNQMVAIREIKKNEIEDYFQEHLGDVDILSNNPLIEDSLSNFIEVFEDGLNRRWIK